MRSDPTKTDPERARWSATLAVGVAMALGGLVACGQGTPEPEPVPGASPPATTPPGPTATPSPTPTGPEVELFEFTISGGVADPPVERATVPRGATVRIVVTSDAPGDVHVHGYDLAVELAPRQRVTLEFVADQVGLFEVETHPDHLVLLQLVIR